MAKVKGKIESEHSSGAEGRECPERRRGRVGLTRGVTTGQVQMRGWMGLSESHTSLT